MGHVQGLGGLGSPRSRFDTERCRESQLLQGLPAPHIRSFLEITLKLRHDVCVAVLIYDTSFRINGFRGDAKMKDGWNARPCRRKVVTIVSMTTSAFLLLNELSSEALAARELVNNNRDLRAALSANSASNAFDISSRKDFLWLTFAGWRGKWKRGGERKIVTQDVKQTNLFACWLRRLFCYLDAT